MRKSRAFSSRPGERIKKNKGEVKFKVWCSRCLCPQADTQREGRETEAVPGPGFSSQGAEVNQTDWLNCVKVLKIQPNKHRNFKKSSRGVQATCFPVDPISQSPCGVPFGSCRWVTPGGIAGPGFDQEIQQACGFSRVESVDTKNPQHIGRFKCTFIIGSHFPPFVISTFRKNPSAV